MSISGTDSSPESTVSHQGNPTDPSLLAWLGTVKDKEKREGLRQKLVGQVCSAPQTSLPMALPADSYSKSGDVPIFPIPVNHKGVSTVLKTIQHLY